MTTEYEEELPPFLKIANELRRRISNGTYPPGTLLPAQTKLADEEFKVARMTVRGALKVLAREGLIQTSQGKGSLVLSPQEEVEEWTQSDSNAMAIARIKALETEVANLSERVAKLEGSRNKGLSRRSPRCNPSAK